MKIKRWVSSKAELQKKIKTVHAYIETWSAIWQATSESDSKSYNIMSSYQTLELHYAKQLKKREENTKEIRLKNLCDDILIAVQRYLDDKYLTSPARLQSINRLLTHCNMTLQNNVLCLEEKRLEIAGFILKELNETEKSHNNNFFSKQYTHSRLATLYMSIFEENGIDPDNDRLKNKANELKTKENDAATCQLFSLRIM